jgi:hypothetical protein
MSELYFEGSVVTAFAAARKAGEYAARGEHFDIHCGDAAIEAVGQIHALLREHKDEPQPVGATPATALDCGSEILALCEEYEAAPVGADEAGLDPGTIALLFQLLPLVIDLFKRWRS